MTYETNSPRELQKEFEAAVEDYIETCTHVGKEPQRPLKGQFNVRITPELHRVATLRTCQDRVSLNEVVGQALDAHVNAGTTEVRHHGLHEGIHDLMTQDHIGSGGVGPAPGERLPGLMIGLARIGLVKVPVAGPNSVDASQVNPATTAARKRAARKPPST